MRGDDGAPRVGACEDASGSPQLEQKRLTSDTRLEQEGHAIIRTVYSFSPLPRKRSSSSEKSTLKLVRVP